MPAGVVAAGMRPYGNKGMNDGDGDGTRIGDVFLQTLQRISLLGAYRRRCIQWREEGTQRKNRA